MPRHEIATRRVVYEIAGADAVRIRRDHPYRVSDGQPLGMDLYYPPHAAPNVPLPAVVFALGVSDIGARVRLGCAMKEMESYIGWATLAAMSGMVGVTYSTGADPAGDGAALFEAIRRDAATLAIDPERIAIWAASGNGPNALNLLMQPQPVRIRCATLYYTYSIDLDGRSDVADAQKTWGFVNAAAGRTIDDMPAALPLLVVRAGCDTFAGLNPALDRFVAAALARNLPITLVNHADGPHAFDLFDDREVSRAIVRQTLEFMTTHL